MSRSACLTARGQSSLPGAYRHTGGQVTDEVVGRGLHGVVGHRVEDVHDVQRQHVGASETVSNDSSPVARTRRDGPKYRFRSSPPSGSWRCTKIAL